MGKMDWQSEVESKMNGGYDTALGLSFFLIASNTK